MLRAEWRALRNACCSKQGRDALIGGLVVLACLVVGGLAIGSMFTADELLSHYRDPGSGALAAVALALLALPAMLVPAFGKVPCRQQLFGSAHALVWLTAPVGVIRVLGAVWLRQWAGAVVASLAIVAPPVFAIQQRASLPTTVAWAWLLMVVVTVAVVTAAMILLLVLFARFATGGRLRQVLTLLHVGFCVVVIVLLLAGMGRGVDAVSWLQSLDLFGERGAWLAELLVGLPVACAASDVAASHALAPIAMLVGAAVCVCLAACWYRAAYERTLCATSVARTFGTSRWPSTPVASLLRRGLLESWRARGNLAVVALFGVFAVWRTSSSPYVPVVDDLSPFLRQVFALLLPWMFVVCVLAMLVFLGVVGDEQKQISLLATSPMSRTDLLKSRVVLVGWPFALLTMLVAVAGPLVGGVEVLAAMAFVLVSVPVAMALLGSVLAVGSWPAFIAVHDQLPLASNLRSVVPVLVLSCVTAAIAFGIYSARHHLLHEQPAHAGYLLVLALAFGAAAFGAGWRLARSNLERLLGPQP